MSPMNKTIKFRAWYIKGQFMDYNPDIWDDKINSGIEGLTGNHVRGSGKPIYHLMQFTGLLDKNGKEIYEGDVLKNSLEESRISVRWDITGASWNFDELDCELDDGVGRGNWYFTMGVAKECEVIGNIYENPNLTINENT